MPVPLETRSSRGGEEGATQESRKAAKKGGKLTNRSVTQNSLLIPRRVLRFNRAFTNGGKSVLERERGGERVIKRKSER